MAEDGQRGRDVDGRRQRILDYLQRETSAQVIELAERFGVSRMTVHRDLDVLSEQGFVLKVHGGARAAPLKRVETDYAQRSLTATAEKRAIARAAAALVQPDQVVAIDDSSTGALLAGTLAGTLGEGGRLTVITNGLGAIERLQHEPAITVIGLGGSYLPHYHGFFGTLSEQNLRHLRADMVFISAQTIWQDAIFHPEEVIARNQRALLAVAERRVLLADNRKFGAPALHRVAALAEFDVVVTDAGLGAAELALLRDGDREIVVADLES
ncbi:MAG: DeoR/GlpR transcriptional regulator [Gluconacetobacter diazotrophicus]|nr:DeoR/GlpR transcriptional regulator [Gluconacetobacter diazotrophicus]